MRERGKKQWNRLGLLLMLFCFTFLPVKQVKAEAPYASFTNTNEWEVVKIVNRERVKKGLEPLSIMKALQSACDVRANEISTSFAHQRPNGTSWSDLLKQKDIVFYAAGENIAAGQPDPEYVMNSWMNSEGHKANILNKNYSHVGVGYQSGGAYGKYWVQLFVGGCANTKTSIDTPVSCSYPVGTSIEKMNRYLVLECNLHGKSYMPVISSMCSGYKKDQLGKQTIKVSYGGNTYPMTVELTASTEGHEASGETGTAGGTETGMENGSNEPSVNQIEKPGKVTGLTIVKKGKNQITIKWTKKKCDGYSVYYGTKKNGPFKKYKTIKTNQTTKCTVKKLKSKKRYYFKVRAYNKNGSGKKYGAFSKIKSARTNAG